LLYLKSMDSKNLCLTILDKAGVPINSPEPWSIHVKNEMLWDRVVSQHELGLGESYMDGWWECQAIDQMLTKLVTADAVSQLTPSLSIIWSAIKSNILNMQTKTRAAKNAKHHYNIGNELYERMLDSEMAYSCGYWKRAKNLNEAQLDKFDLICKKLKLEKGMTLLDIGSGWGGFLRHAVKNYGVIATGVSPADQQILLAKARSVGLNINFYQMDYRDLTGRFDRIVSIGMMEHVGPKNFKEFFEKCEELLTDDGIMLHHLISSTRSQYETDGFFNRYIFPGGVIPSPAQITRAAEDIFVLEDVHNFGLDYDKTLMSWHRNISQKWDEIPEYDIRFKRMWDYYLLASAAGFRSRNLNLNQYVFRKEGILEPYIANR
jgi:cyclopropane-fatty-acyl-phospholipid synthase